MSHKISLGPTRPGAGAAVLPATMPARSRPARSRPVPVPGSGPARTHPVRIPGYRWRMMVALAAVVSSGFLLGMLLTALH